MGSGQNAALQCVVTIRRKGPAEMSWWILLFLCVFVGILLSGITRFLQNERSPVVTVPAVLTKKKTSSYVDANHVTTTKYFVEFEIGADAGILRCAVPYRVYRRLEEGVSGTLTHQGTRFQAFAWNGIRVEK